MLSSLLMDDNEYQGFMRLAVYAANFYYSVDIARKAVKGDIKTPKIFSN